MELGSSSGSYGRFDLGDESRTTRPHGGESGSVKSEFTRIVDNFYEGLGLSSAKNFSPNLVQHLLGQVAVQGTNTPHLGSVDVKNNIGREKLFGMFSNRELRGHPIFLEENGVIEEPRPHDKSFSGVEDLPLKDNDVPLAYHGARPNGQLASNCDGYGNQGPIDNHPGSGLTQVGLFGHPNPQHEHEKAE